MVRNGCILRLIALAGIIAMALSSSGCGTGSGNVSNATTADVNTSVTSVPDDYIRDAAMPDGEYNFRVYKDQLLFHIDGKDYVALGHYADTKPEGPGKMKDGYIQYTDDDIKNMRVGDEFVYDHDIRFTINSLEVEDWEWPYNDLNHPEIANGRIRLNDKYSLVHCVREYDDSGHVTNEEEASNWKLIYDNQFRNPYTCVMVVDSVYLMECPDNCKLSTSSKDGPVELTKADLLTFFDEYFPAGREYCYCEVTIRQNKAAMLFFATIVDDI